MSARLQTDALELPRSALNERMANAVETVRKLQTGDTQPQWQKRTKHQLLHVSDELDFVPDGQDAKHGMVGMIAGGIAGVFGLVFAGIILEGAQAERWMRFAAPGLIALGGYLLWDGWQKNLAAKNEPRITGAYLFPDVLLHVGTMGCRTFPKQRIRSFDYRQIQEGSPWTLFIRYLDEGNTLREATLFYRDATSTLDDWLTSS